MASPDRGSSSGMAIRTGWSEALTEGVRVSVRSRYLPDRSNPLAGEFLFAYEVTIGNEGDNPVRLLTRHWIIRDALGTVEEVEGVGVLGESPTIPPGGSHVYASHCPLWTEFGTMEGSYGMVRSDNSTFRATVAALSLARPSAIN